MTTKSKLIMFATVVVCVICIGMIGNEAYAQGSSSLDKDMASRQGISESLANGSKENNDDSRTPSRLQMGVGIGSCVVAFVVLKYL